MYYVKYMPYKSIISASRNRRELAAAKESGFNTIVFSNDHSGDVNSYGIDKVLCDGALKMPMSSKPKGMIMIIRNRLRVYKNTNKIPTGIWSCHDLHSLKIAYAATRFRKQKPLFIYDSHEFELGRNAQRNFFQQHLVMLQEKFLMNRCVLSIMVNDSIADEVQRIYKLKERPIVVRSTPNYWAVDENVCKEKRKVFLDTFKEQGEETVSCMIMYHGGVVKDRGIERLIEAVSRLDGVGLVVLGNGSEGYIAQLKTLVNTVNADKKVVFHPAVPIDELWKYVGAIDISMAPIEVVVKNHYYSLPNKFFESIQSLTPIIASDVPEMKRIIEQYQIGLTSKPGDVDDICRCIETMRNDKDFYLQCKRNLIKAKEDLCWEKERAQLLDAFQTIQGRRQAVKE